MSDYPEHEKLTAIKDQSQCIGSFLEAMQQEGLVLCSYFTPTHEEREDGAREGYEPTRKDIQKILADYFSIDLDVLEKEKVAMLDNFRKATT